MDWTRDGDPLHVRTVPVQGVTSSQLIIGTQAWLLGWALTEPTGTDPATVEIIDGNDAAGQLVALVQLAAGQQSIIHPGTPGFPCDAGVYLSVITGTVTGSLTLGSLS